MQKFAPRRNLRRKIVKFKIPQSVRQGKTGRARKDALQEHKTGFKTRGYPLVATNTAHFL